MKKLLMTFMASAALVASAARAADGSQSLTRPPTAQPSSSVALRSRNAHLPRLLSNI